METWAKLFSILWLIGGVSGFQWSGSDSGPIQVCSGHSIELLWNFTLDRGERVKHTVWRYQVEGGSEDTLATCVDGHFVPMSNFSGRLALHKDGGIELSCATILESGNYSVIVSVEQRDSSQTRYSKTTTVKVVDTPKTQSGEIHVTTKAEAVRDVTTGAWHVHLACGNFSDLGHPPVDVIWTTPRGEQLESSGYEDGVFLLVLANPVLEGNYSCRIAPALPAAHCLPPHSPLHNTEVVQVEAAAARITVMEAQQRELVDTIVQMKDTMAEMNDTMEAQQREMNNTMAAERREMDQRISLLEKSMDQIHRNSVPVYFHARLGSNIWLPRDSILKLTRIITNQGGGYNSTTGEFTAPVNGTFFFIGTAAPESRGGKTYMSIDKEEVRICHTLVIRQDYYGSTGSCHGVVDMKAGERVWLVVTRNSHLSLYTTSFSGFRID